MKKFFRILLPMMALIGIATVFTSCADMFTSPENMRYVREYSANLPSDLKIDIQICSGDFKNGEYCCGSVLKTFTNFEPGQVGKISDVVTGMFMYGIKVRKAGTGDYVEIRNGDSPNAEVCCLALNKDFELVIHAAWDSTNSKEKYYYTWDSAK